MRLNNSVRNSITAFVSNFLLILIGFVSQKLFVLILDKEYLGVNGLFANIISILSIAELGIGEIIIYNLYKPVSKNNKEEIKSLLNVYKKAYNIIVLVIFVLGIALIPFLHYFIGKNSLDLNFTIVYLLFLGQTLLSYILTYKRSIIYAYQKNYIINIIHLCITIVINVLQLLLLYITKNYYLYVSVKMIFVLIENIIITIYANKLFPFIKEKNVKKVKEETRKDIINRIKAQFLHKIGGVVVNSTDNIIISNFFGLMTVGLYTNYSLIIVAVRNLFSQIFSSITASVGDLLVENNPDKSFDTYKKIRFLNFWVACFCSISVLIIIQPFVCVWLGEDFLLSFSVVIVLVINLYQKLMRNANDVFLSGAGICIENRIVPIIESILNIVCSIVCLKIFGLPGVFIGTIISGLALWCYSYPVFVYKKIFNRDYMEFIIDTLKYMLLFVCITVITYYFSKLFVFDSFMLQVLINVLICISIPNILLFIIFRKNENYYFFIDLIKSFTKRKKA